MAVSKIKKALEMHLAAMSPNISTAYPNVNFVPVAGVPYQRVFIVPRTPLNPTMGDDHYREQGEFQVFLCYPTNVGEGSVLARAEAVQSHFKRGTDLTESGLVINIRYTPQISGPSILGDRIVVPVIVRYEADVF